MGTSCSITIVLFLLFLHLGLEQGWHGSGLGLASGCLTVEREALLKFKSSLEDPANRLSSWKGEHCCDWDGVRCDNITGQVYHLDLRNVHYVPHSIGYNEDIELRGAFLDPSLVELTHLRYLDLGGNNFQLSPIPKFIGSFKHLRYLNLSGASFGQAVPPEIGNLTRLLALDLTCSNIESSDAIITNDLSWISGLSHLQSLNMGGVNLTVAESSLQALNKLPSLLDLRLVGSSLTNPLYLSRAFCNSTSVSTIEHLDLSHNLIQGMLPDCLANMTSLTFLDLSDNQFSGPIPHWLKNMRALESISLGSNSFSHIDGGAILGNLCKLKVLDLSQNGILEGEIAGPYENSSKCLMYDLEYLNLMANRFTGTLPHWLGELESLTYLNLKGNSFHGQIPPSVGELKSLRYVSLRNNKFDGQIPSSLGSLSLLEVLDLSHNGFSGHVPESLGQCMSLKHLLLSSNFLEGVVSNYHLANLSSLDTLDLSFNPLNFSFSSNWIPPFQLRSFRMSSCRIQAQLPHWIETQNNLQVLDLSSNQIYGMMLNWSRNIQLDSLDLSNNSLVGPITHFPSQISSIDLSHNSLYWPLPQDFPITNGEVGISLCNLRNLQFLNLQNNSISGKLPSNCWGNSPLFFINLSSNKLSGHIPMSLGQQSNLRFLSLNNNSFEGKVPPTLSNCTMLEVLDLGENKLWGEVPSLEVFLLGKLQILRLRANQFTGVIPQQLCSQVMLQILDLAENNLTGRIPRCFGDFFSMAGRELSVPARMTPMVGSAMAFAPFPKDENTKEVLKGEELLYTTTLEYVYNLDLSCNNLVGSIPEELSNLSKLIGLNLSHNHLTGRIPEGIGAMSSLESLDLSDNNIQGTIPASISALRFLSHLNLSHNNLHGQIPTGPQLQTLNDPSIYANNRGLCGDPLPNKCTRDQSPRQHGRGEQGQEEEEEDDDHREKVLFYLVIMLGFGTGFWGVIGILVLKKQWRFALFQQVEDAMDYLYVEVVARINRLRG